MKRVLVFILTCFLITADKADNERIFVNARINDKSVRLMIDTGTDIPLALYSTAVKKLGINYTPPDGQPVPGSVPLGRTDLRYLYLEHSILGTDTNLFIYEKAQIPVIEVASYANLPEDGIIGWHAIKGEVFSIDAIKKDKMFSGAKGLFESDKWQTFQLETNLDTLAFDIPLGKGTNGLVLLDTGSIFGIELNLQEWSKWKTTHTNQPFTFNFYYSPSLGQGIREESWAERLSLGSLMLTDVPVTEATSADLAAAFLPQTQYIATLGLAALQRLDIIVDGKNGFIFVRPKTTPSLPYQHNRLGADFTPQDFHGDDHVARVVNGSPAYEAGVRDGDFLLGVSRWDDMKWHIDTNMLSEIYEYPAGTKLELTLKRNDKIFKTTTILRNILPPDTANN
jgi:hypothetical protein